jgi:hypothetical protein
MVSRAAVEIVIADVQATATGFIASVAAAHAGPRIDARFHRAARAVVTVFVFVAAAGLAVCVAVAVAAHPVGADESTASLALLGAAAWLALVLLGLALAD